MNREEIQLNSETKPLNHVVIPISNTTVFSGKVLTNGNNNNNNNLQHNDANSSISLERVEAGTLSPNSSKVPLISSKPDEANKIDDPEDVSQLFSFLQILTATFGG